MDEQVITNAFEQSIQWLNHGRTIADCLQAYPELADQLAPMLEVGNVVRRAQMLTSEVAAAQGRVQQKLYARQKRRTQFKRLSWVIAATMVFGFSAVAVAQFVGLNRFQNAPGSLPTQINDLTATETSTETVTVTNTLTDTPRVKPSATQPGTTLVATTPLPSSTPFLTPVSTTTVIVTKTPTLRPPTIQPTHSGPSGANEPIQTRTAIPNADPSSGDQQSSSNSRLDQSSTEHAGSSDRNGKPSDGESESTDVPHS